MPWRNFTQPGGNFVCPECRKNDDGGARCVFLNVRMYGKSVVYVGIEAPILRWKFQVQHDQVETAVLQLCEGAVPAACKCCSGWSALRHFRLKKRDTVFVIFDD